MLLKFALPIALIVGLVGCGKTGTEPEGDPEQGPYTRSLSGTVASLGYTEHDLVMPRSGHLVVRLSWNGVADLDLYLTNGECDPPNNCVVHDVSDQVDGNLELVSKVVNQGESIKIWVDNFAEASTRYTLSIEVE